MRKRKLRGHWRLGVLHRPAPIPSPQQPSRSRSPTNRLADRVASPTSASASLRLRVPSRRPRARCRYPCPLHSAPASLVAEPATRAARGPVPRRTVPRLAALARPRAPTSAISRCARAPPRPPERNDPIIAAAVAGWPLPRATFPPRSLSMASSGTHQFGVRDTQHFTRRQQPRCRWSSLCYLPLHIE